jgi:hypothetical protein
MEILHFTSEESWQGIQSSGFLSPRTDPNNFEFNLPKKLKEIMPLKGYLVGIPLEGYPGWKAHKLVDRLLSYTSGEVLLSLPILCEDKSFIRDHALNSPERLNKEKGIDIVEFQERLMDSSYSLTEEYKQVREIIEKTTRKFQNDYVNSSILLEDYHGQYAAPEIWLPQVTPMDSIERIDLKK